MRVARWIDDTFANSPWETLTQTEKAFAASFVKQMGNIEFLILTIGCVVFFTLLLVAGNTMAIAVRERAGELAVLKAIGFPDGSVLCLMAGSLLIAGLGGSLGLRLAKLFTLGGDPTGGLLPYFLGGSRGFSGAGARGWHSRGNHAGNGGDAPAGSRRAEEDLSMAIPIIYNVRSVQQRWILSIVAVLGMAGTVGVFVAMLALARGFRATLSPRARRATRSCGAPAPTPRW